MELKWKVSEMVEGSYEANLTVKIINVAEKGIANKNGTVYHPCTIELQNGDVVSGIMYDSNFQYGVEKGSNVLAKAIYNPTVGEDVLIQVSHLVAAKRANIATFGFKIEETELDAIAKEEKAFAKVK